jgi:Lrp/AsnC family leucine-responsive transcriptional regulator
MTKITTPANLDSLDRRLLRAVQEQCTLTAEDLAERCGTSPSTALRRLTRLRSTGVIRHEVAVVDGPAVGRGLLMIVSVRTRRGQQADTESFRKAMLANPAVMQFYFVTGRSDYVVIYSAASMDEYDEFIESVLAIDPNLLTDTNVVIRPLKVSLTIPISPMPSTATPAPMPRHGQPFANLDSLDRRLLRAVQLKCTATAEELADSCGTSPSTALRRLNRLRANGVIRSEIAIVDAGKVGRSLLLLVAVRLEHEDGGSVDAFIERIVGHPSVQQFYFVTGTSDYLIIFSAGSMEEYHDFVKDNLVRDPVVVMSSTNVVIRALKAGLSIPIPA